MKKIEIITNYFPPEMGAASSRIFNLAKGLQNQGYDVEVVAPIPNYPFGKIFEAYQGRFKITEEIDGIKTRRYWIYPTVSNNFILRFLGMLSFAITLWGGLIHYWKRRPDIMIIQYSPQLVSLSAIILSKLLPKCHRVLNVSDLWPLTAAELQVIKDDSIMYKMLENIEKYSYKNSDLIIGQSSETLSYIKGRVEKPLFLYRNISPELSTNKISSDKYHFGRPKIVYAGLLGVAQGIYKICTEVDFKRLGVEFHIYGNGNETESILEFLKENKESNIYYHGSLPKGELLKKLPMYHASIVPLANRIYGALPSKIFELIAFGVPILFCGGGEGAEIIDENQLGYVSSPGDVKKLEDNILKLAQTSQSDYQKLLLNCDKFTKDKLNFEDQLKDLINNLQELGVE